MDIDVDVNHLYADESDLLEYLSEGYAERFEEYGQPMVGVRGIGNTVGFEKHGLLQQLFRERLILPFFPGNPLGEESPSTHPPCTALEDSFEDTLWSR